jgi:hypothetical protein
VKLSQPGTVAKQIEPDGVCQIESCIQHECIQDNHQDAFEDAPLFAM